MRTIIRDLIRGRRRVAADSSHDNALRHLESQTPPSRSEARRWPSRVMKVLTSAIVGLLALSARPYPRRGSGLGAAAGVGAGLASLDRPSSLGARMARPSVDSRTRPSSWLVSLARPVVPALRVALGSAASPRVALLLTRWPDPRRSGQHRPRGDGPRPCPANCASG
jgi:hypothetical protein